MRRFVAACAVGMCFGLGACGGGDTVARTLPFADDFSGECVWPDGSNGGAFAYGCSDGRYKLTLKGRGFQAYHVTQGFDLHSKALRIEVDTVAKNGALVGIGCIKDDQHGYLASVSTDGAWGIGRIAPDNRIVWLTGTHTHAVSLPSPGTPIRIGIMCGATAGDGANAVAVLVNGRAVGSTNDPARSGYESFDGVFLYAETDPGSVTYDNLAAREATRAEITDAQSKATHGQAQ
jgi:hypothetical protein